MTKDWAKKYRNAWYNKKARKSVIIHKIRKPKHYIVQLADEKNRRIVKTEIASTLKNAELVAKKLMR
ncbi:MAG: hypothetical protein DRN24_07115 [Thermoplasmata archaeon]|nr:MAG: hypothetical protein DRN24_07115 [Thermoplasmata archaeon]